MLDFRTCWFHSFTFNFKCLNLTDPQHPLHEPFSHLSFNFSFFDFPFPSKHITLLVCQLSPKRLQASFLNNRSNQLPSFSFSPCVPLYSSLFSSRECKGRIIWTADWPGHVDSKSLEAHLTIQHCMQMFAVLSRDRQMHSCSITLDTDPLNPKIRQAKPHSQWRSHLLKLSCNGEAEWDHSFCIFENSYRIHLHTHAGVFVRQCWSKTPFHSYLVSKMFSCLKCPWMLEFDSFFCCSSKMFKLFVDQSVISLTFKIKESHFWLNNKTRLHS